MEPRLVRSQHLWKQVSRELRGRNMSLRPHCHHPNTGGSWGHRECGVEGCLRVEWEGRSWPGAAGGGGTVWQGKGGLRLGSRTSKPQGFTYPLRPQCCGEAMRGPTGLAGSDFCVRNTLLPVGRLIDEVRTALIGVRQEEQRLGSGWGQRRPISGRSGGWIAGMGPGP